MGTNGGDHGLGESDDHWRLSLEDATRLFSSCEQLSSVSLAMPEVSLRDVDQDDYDTYKTVLVSINHKLRILDITDRNRAPSPIRPFCDTCEFSLGLQLTRSTMGLTQTCKTNMRFNTMLQCISSMLTPSPPSFSSTSHPTALAAANWQYFA